MSEKDGLFSYLQLQSDQRRIGFLRTELEACFTLARIAEIHYNSGKQEHAKRSVADVEKGYATMQRFLSDPRHAKHISDKEREELTAGMERLRKTLDGLAERQR